MCGRGKRLSCRTGDWDTDTSVDTIACAGVMTSSYLSGEIYGDTNYWLHLIYSLIHFLLYVSKTINFLNGISYFSNERNKV